ncbi:MAG: immune inhibitor A [Chloroflexi bacterium]|nr:immune inhibitor A [Chloroflexota bacterium]
MIRLILLLTLIGTLIFTPVSANTYPAQHDTPSQQGSDSDDSAALAEALVPPRDRLSLAQRLLGVMQIPPIPTEPQRIYEIGDTETFFVQNTDEGAFSITAELVYVNDVVYMWVQGGYNLDLNSLKESADEFATEIYPAIREVFGSEASPGIDGDERLHVLHSADLGADTAGYFYSESQYPQVAVSTSNEREMFFLSVDSLGIYAGSDYYNSVLAHEFQHMIHWAVDANEESWLNEGLSELAAYIAGFGVSGFAGQYLQAPHTQLTYWPTNGRGIIYGGSFLFTMYLLDRFGIDAIREIVANPANGMDGIELALEALDAVDPVTGKTITAEVAFMDFSVANYLDDPSLGQGQYSYEQLSISEIPSLTQSYDFSTDVTLSDTKLAQWSTQYYTVEGLTPGQQYTMNFNGNTTVGLLPADPFSGEYAYWSNRVDDSDTRLTRAFDLSNVESATLSFMTWYDIEENWDYAYVMVSTDDGLTWTPLQTPRTTTENPHNTSYGHGYTGQSSGWIQETLDLSSYAGQGIMLRWEYITDDATIENGFLLDDVSIPEINFFDDFEQIDPAWNVEGWVRIQNMVNQTFGLQVIFPDDRVERLLVPNGGVSGEWTIVPPTDELIIVFSAFAPVTTEPATIEFSLVE